MTGKGAQDKKQMILSSMLLDPKGWKESMLSIAIGVEVEGKKATARVPMSRGELEQVHGYSEATRMINGGKFEMA